MLELFADRVSLDCSAPIWRHFFMVSPLVVVGSKENQHYDLAPKHMVTALGHDNYFGFVCTPDHATYQNISREGVFTVSFPRPDQIVLASLAAAPRNCNEEEVKAIVDQVATVPAKHVDALLMQDAYLWLECELDKIVDGFGKFSLIAGAVIAAHVHQDSYIFSDGDGGQMIGDAPLLAYLPYDRFAIIAQSQKFPYPQGFDKDV